MVFFILIIAVSVNTKFFLVHLIPPPNEVITNKDIGYNPSKSTEGDDYKIYKTEDNTHDRDYQGYDAYFGSYFLY